MTRTARPQRESFGLQGDARLGTRHSVSCYLLTHPRRTPETAVRV